MKIITFSNVWDLRKEVVKGHLRLIDDQWYLVWRKVYDSFKVIEIKEPVTIKVEDIWVY